MLLDVKGLKKYFPFEGAFSKDLGLMRPSTTDIFLNQVRRCPRGRRLRKTTTAVVSCAHYSDCRSGSSHDDGEVLMWRRFRRQARPFGARCRCHFQDPFLHVEPANDAVDIVRSLCSSRRRQRAERTDGS